MSRITQLDALIFLVWVLSDTSVRAATIDDARKEGTLVFYGSMTSEHHNKLVGAFSQKYPFIKSKGFAQTPDRSHRV